MDARRCELVGLTGTYGRAHCNSQQALPTTAIPSFFDELRKLQRVSAL